MGGQRAKLSKRLSDADAIALFAEHHIVQVRRRKNGEIVNVKHAAWGWISPTTYYAMQEFHALLPKIVEGGYRLKEALWGLSVVVGPVTIPVGLAFPVLELRALVEAIDAGNIPNAVEWAYALVGPFGDIIAVAGLYNWLISGGIQQFGENILVELFGGSTSPFISLAL